MRRLIGYWTDTRDRTEKWIHPKHLVSPGWESARLPNILSYLRSGKCVSSEMGYSYCRFPGGPPDSQMGSRFLTDGVWEWPEGLVVYVERFHVRLPDEFIRHMEDVNFSINHSQIHTFVTGPVDIEFWRAWCKKQRNLRLKQNLSRVPFFKYFLK